MNEILQISSGVNEKHGILKKNSEGFSLIELMVAMCIMAIVIGSIMGFFSNMTKTTTTQNVVADVQETLMMGLDYVVRDLRRAGYDYLGTSGAGVLACSSTSFQFTSDELEDGDTTFNSTDEDITYSFAGSGLQRVDSSIAGTETLISNVDTANSSFTYYDSDGNTTTTPADVRTIQVILQITSPAGRDGSVTRTLTRRVKARNLP